MSTVYNKQQHTLEMPLWLVIKNYRWPGCEKICCRERSKRSVRKSHFKRSIKIWPVWASIWALIFAFEMPLIWRFLSAYFKINALSSHWVSECWRQLEWKALFLANKYYEHRHQTTSIWKALPRCTRASPRPLSLPRHEQAECSRSSALWSYSL